MPIGLHHLRYFVAVALEELPGVGAWAHARSVADARMLRKH